MYRFLSFGVVAIAFGSANCAGNETSASAGGGGTGSSTISGMQQGTTGSQSTSNVVSSSTGFGSGGTMASTGTGPDMTTPFYVHDDTTLYTYDATMPMTPPVMVGPFDCIGVGGDSAMTDIGVAANGDIWAVSSANKYSIEIQPGGVVHCANKTSLKAPSGVHFYALTLAPQGVLDPNNEVLVAGNSAGELWSIDDMGNVLQHGNFGTVPTDDGHMHTYAATNVGNPWELSGDIVFLSNGGNPVGFATVRDCPSPPSSTGCSTTDTLIQIDLTKLATATTTDSVTLAVRGKIVPKASCPSSTSFGSIYGIAALGADVYGFSRKGDIIQIDNVDGSACLLQATSNKWAGAGVTTLAKVVAPPPQ
jgi:hypothetical protein